MTDCACNPWCVRYAGHIGGCSPTPLERDVPDQGAPHDPRDRFCNDANVCAEVFRLRAENERLREAIALHARTLDDRALGHPEHNQRDRDSIDNDLYNLTRRIDPAWWDERFPGMAGSPRPIDEQRVKCPYCDDGDYIDPRGRRHRCAHCDGTNSVDDAAARAVSEYPDAVERLSDEQGASDA